MKIFIIGSEGFIGSHCVDYFLNEKYQVYGIDLKDTPHCSYQYKKILPTTIEYLDFFQSIKPDICLFTSGSANVSNSFSDPFADFEANTSHVFRILDSIKKTKLNCKFINFSSAAIYGNPDKLPIAESFQSNPVSPYGWHKLFSEQICKEFHNIWSIQTCNVRPFSVYGPRQTKLLFWDLSQKSRINKETIELFGTGNESRDYISIHDLVKAIEIIIKAAPMNGEAYNLASGTEYTIAMVSEIFLRQLNYSGKIIFNQEIKKGDPINWRADISKLSNLGFHQTVTIEEGLSEYANWIKQYYK